MFPSIGTLGAVVLGGALGVASVGIAFAMGMRRAVLAIFLVRSSCDPVFGLTQAEDGGMGVGAAVNVLVIVLALLFFLESPILIGSAILPWAGFLMTALASVIGSPEPMMKALRGFFVLTSYAAVFALPLALIRSRQWALRCLTVVMCSSIIPVTYAFVEMASRTAEDDPRLRSTFGHANIFAYYLVSLLALTLFLLRSSLAPISPRVRLWLVLYLPIIIVLLLLTGSRGAWVSGAIVLIVYASIIDKRYLLCLLLVPVLIYVPTVEERLSDLQTGNLDYGYAQLNSYAWRKLLWQSALDWLMDNPSTSLWLGYGWGSFKYYSPIFFPRAAPDGMVAHNAILQTFFEMGILGLLAFLWVFVALFAKLKIGYSFDKAGATIMMTLALSYLVASYGDNMFAYLAFQWYFWFIMGVVCAWYKLRSTPQPVDTSMVQGLISAQSAERRTA